MQRTPRGEGGAATASLAPAGGPRRVSKGLASFEGDGESVGRERKGNIDRRAEALDACHSSGLMCEACTMYASVGTNVCVCMYVCVFAWCACVRALFGPCCHGQDHTTQVLERAWVNGRPQNDAGDCG